MPGIAPNNRVAGAEVTPSLAWHDAEMLARANPAATPGKTYSGSVHARAIIGLFESAGVQPPTYWGVLQWVRRKNVPDRWRPTLAYVLLRDKKIMTNQLFRKQKSEPTGTKP